MSFEGDGIGRRKFLKVAAAALAAGPTILAASGAIGAGKPTKGKPQRGAADQRMIRVASVSTTIDGGVLPPLVELFKSRTGLNVVLTRDDEPYGPARHGKYDLVISHFGHKDVQEFVLKGYGLWPQTVFSNQLCLAGPPSDPAKVRGLTDLVQAFRQIAEAQAPYVLNDTKGIRYLTETVWNAAGKPAKGAWFIDTGINKKEAVVLAAQRNAYVIWGLTPFIREQAARGELVPLVTKDPLLERMMVTIAVNPAKVKHVNLEGAMQFEEFLLQPEIQAAIMKTHYTGADQTIWEAGGRNNSPRVLPR